MEKELLAWTEGPSPAERNHLCEITTSNGLIKGWRITADMAVRVERLISDGVYK